MHSSISFRSRKDWGLLAILLAIFLARLSFAALVFARPALAIANDSDRYVPIGSAILEGQALVPDATHTGLLLNTVGYPLFLAVVFLILGHGAGDIALAQLAMSGLLALVVYLALERSIGAASAFVSALILLIDPLTILWSMTILTESLLAVVFGLAAVAITAWAQSERPATLILAGILAGLACLVKPYILVVVGVWAAALFFHPGPDGVSRGRRLLVGLRRALLFVAPTVLLAAPWVIRNALIWDCPGLSSVDRVTMRDFVGAKILSEAEHVPLDQIQAEFQASDPGVCPVQSSKYVNIVFTHLGIFAKLHAAGTIPVLVGTNFDRWFQFFGVEYTLPDLWGPFVDGGLGKLISVLVTEWIRFPPGLSAMAIMILFQLAVYAFAFVGVLLVRGLASPAIRWNMIVLTLTILYMVLTPGQGGNERFRVPVQPLLAILVGYGLAWTILPHFRKPEPLGHPLAPKA